MAELESQSSEKEVKHQEEHDDESGDEEYDPYYPPLMILPEVDAKSNEEDEEIICSYRARMYRFTEAEEWKERGTGTVKLLRHPEKNYIRLVMRREQTLKLCANHCVLPELSLKPYQNSQTTWLWKTPADYSEDLPKPELLALRLKTAQEATEFKRHFDQAREFMNESRKESTGTTETKPTTKDAGEEEKCAKELEKLTVKDDNDKATTDVGITSNEK